MTGKTASLSLAFGILVASLPGIAVADGGWSPPNYGYVISTTTPQRIPQHSGQSALITGTIEVAGRHNLCDGDGSGGGDNSSSENGKGSQKNDLLSQLSQNGTVIQAFFPDPTTDVSAAVSLTAKGCNQVQFSYTTPVLSASALNSFNIQVVHVTEDVVELERVQAKLDLRAKMLQAIISGQGSSAPKEDLKILQDLNTRLSAISARITQLLQTQSTVLAQQVFPLQIDNIVAGPSLYSTVTNHFRFQVQYALGTAIDGEKTNVTGTVTHLGHSDDDGINDDNSEWVTSFNWNGTQVGQAGPQAIPAGSSISFTYPTPKLEPEVQNSFSMSLNLGGDEGDSGRQYGQIAFLEPTADDQVSPTWLAGEMPAQNTCLSAMQPINVTSFDTFGLVDPASINASLTGTQVNGIAMNQNVTSQITASTPDQGQTYVFSGNLNPIPDGLYGFSISSADLAGSATIPNPYSANFRVNTVPPSVTLGPLAQIYTNSPYTNNPNVSFTATTLDFFDLCSITTTVTDNGSVIATSTGANLSFNQHLADGVHQIEVMATNNSDGLASAPQSFPVIVDTVPPVLSNFVPAVNATILATLSFSVSGQSNEPLLYAKVNGQALSLSADKMSFTGTVTAASAGPLTLHYEVADLATNVTTKDVPVQIILNAINKNLISIRPSANGQGLDIIGAIGSAIPGETITISTGLLSTYTLTANSDGSFNYTVGPFSQVSISGNDPALGISGSTTLTYGPAGGTHLSGVVKDTNGNPLAGVTVSISKNTIPAVQTDATGTFVFNEPVTGDQVLVIDGSTVQTQPGATVMKYSSVSLPVSIGLVQSNVLQRPIYIQGIPTDGSAPTIDPAVGGVVTTAAAPGVQLTIPAGSAQFPGGNSPSPVQIARISSQFSTIKPLDFASPQNVIALEPSGTVFTQPADLTLPNENGLPPGVQVVIMSMDSRNGHWGIDGVGVVSPDGSSISTKPGQGITHFSMVYASPIGPTVRQIGAQDQPGADTFNGALTTSINMPSYKLLGKDVAPTLLYRSSWAKPSTLVTNLFDLSSKEINLNSDTSGNRTISVQSCFAFFCSSQDISVYWQSSVRGTAWYQPRLITAQFFTGSIASPVMNFAGAPLLPERSVVSFGADLIDPNSGNYLASGVYPYITKYQLYLNQLVVGTRTVTAWSSVDPSPQISVYSLNNQTQIAQAFPQDLGGPLFVQNETNSAAGRGWRIAGTQKIANPSSNRLMLQEPDGSISSFTVGNTMTTLFSDTTNPGSMNYGSGFSWPYAYLTDSAGSTIRKVDLTSNGASVQSVGHEPYLTGSVKEFRLTNGGEFAGRVCSGLRYGNIVQQGYPTQLLPLPDGSLFGIDSILNAAYSMNAGGGTSFISGTFQLPPVGGYYNFPAPECGSPGIICDNGGLGSGYVSTYFWLPSYCGSGGFGNHVTCTAQANANDTFGTSGTDCGFWSTPSGQYASPGFNGDGALPRQMNSPLGIAPGPGPNTLVIADTGNNRVRVIDLTAQTMTTVAGNGQTYDNGDGGPATQASLFHPRGVAYDGLGNLYISTENGFIRKVDTTGTISTFAGSSTGTFADTVLAKNALLSEPYGLVVDNTNGYLYVADTGHHRVLRIDFQTQTANAVAGNGNPSDSIDGQAALVGGLTSPSFVGLDNANNLLIVDSGNSKIKRVTFEAPTSGAASYQLSSNPNPGVRQNTDGSWVMALIRNSDGTWTRNYRNGDVAYFDINGNETLYQDRVGRQTRYYFDSGNRITQVVDPTGRSTNYYYGGSNLSSIVDPAGRTTQFLYGPGNTLTEVIFPDGTRRSYTYDKDGLMVSETNQKGSVNSYMYNQYHRLASVQTDAHPPVVVNDSASQTAINNYTGDKVAPAVAYGANPDQASESMVDPMQNKTTFAKDYRGFIETIVDPLGATTEIVRDDLGNPVSITRPDKTQETFVYDPTYQDLISQTDTATGITVSQTYDSYGNLLSQTNGRGKTASTAYTPSGLVQTKADANGNSMNYSYNSLGMVVSTTNALGKSSSVTYDSAGNVTSVADAAGRKTMMTYDQAGNLLTSTDPAGHIYSYQYNVFNQIISATTPKGETTAYAYSPTGKLTQIKDAQNNVVTLQYDDLDRLTTKTDPLGFSEARTYDENSNLIQEIDPNGNVKKYTYNSQGLLTQKTLPDNLVVMQYDSNKRLLSAVDNQSSLNLNYDGGGRLIGATSAGLGQASAVPRVALNFGWDADNNRVSMSDPTGTTSYAFDDGDRLKRITNPLGESFSFGFDPANRLSSIVRPGSQTQFAGMTPISLLRLSTRTARRSVSSSTTETLLARSRAFKQPQRTGRWLTTRTPNSRRPRTLKRLNRQCKMNRILTTPSATEPWIKAEPTATTLTLSGSSRITATRIITTKTETSLPSRRSERESKSPD